jgi:hypothetical protein
MLHRVKPFLGCVASPQNLHNELWASEFENKGDKVATGWNKLIVFSTLLKSAGQFYSPNYSTLPITWDIFKISWVVQT